MLLTPQQRLIDEGCVQSTCRGKTDTDTVHSSTARIGGGGRGAGGRFEGHGQDPQGTSEYGKRSDLCPGHCIFTQLHTHTGNRFVRESLAPGIPLQTISTVRLVQYPNTRGAEGGAQA